MSAPNITLLGATYPTVSGVTLPKQGGGSATFPWVEGSQTISTNGTVDVTHLASVTVSVSGGGGADCPTFTHNLDEDEITCDKSYAECKNYINLCVTGAFYTMKETGEDDYTQGATGEVKNWGQATEYIHYFAMGDVGTPGIEIRYDSNGSITIIDPASSVKSKSVSANGTYYANFDEVWNEVTVAVPEPSGSLTIATNGTYTVASIATVIVEVPTGSTKNVQSCIVRSEVNTTTYTSTDVKVTCNKAGTYKCSWSMDRNTTSGTSGSRLYVGDTAKGTAHTSWTHNGQTCSETLSLALNDLVVIRCRSRNTSYYCGVSNLIIEEQ